MKVYRVNIKDIEPNQLSAWFEQMDDKRKNAVNRMAIEQKRKLRTAADALCREAISDYCGIAPDDIVFEYSEKGKPYAKGLPVYFNISHSGDYAVCAVSDCEIGIDIEKIKPFNIRAAEKFAADSEKKYIRSHQNGFFEIWTLKEAYFKCIGTGLGKDIKNVYFEVSQNGIACSESGFECLFYEIDKDYICSVCKKTAHK
ncbi:MAG: 4'-phosphopantetheinyl transferase superfamily protein [Clostridia bacterium]|nr:4'-phosphopantetheinyl transferase superfamily protein [Clostridia bacterium]MBQ7121579.1 4'-phosphopantetheinyl transferase superfamily protein [Clostridia bacterium]